MVTKLNRKSLRAQQARKESGSLRGVFALPVIVLHANRKRRERETERETDR